MSAFFLSVPSPVQGTSHKIRSNLRVIFSPVFELVTLKFGMQLASWLVTSMHGLCRRLAWWTSM